MPGKTNRSQQKHPAPRRLRGATRSKRLATTAALILAALTLSAGDRGIPQARADHPATIQRLGRLLGAGWGDGYHACRASGFRPGADLPPHGYPDQFGTQRCLDGCGQIFPPGTALPQIRSRLPHLLTGLPSLPPVSGPAVYSSNVFPCATEHGDAGACDDAGDCDAALNGQDTFEPAVKIQANPNPPTPPAATETDLSMELPPGWTDQAEANRNANRDATTLDQPSADQQTRSDGQPLAASPKSVTSRSDPGDVASPSDLSAPNGMVPKSMDQPLMNFSGPNVAEGVGAVDATNQPPAVPDLLNDKAFEQQLPPAGYFHGEDDQGTLDSGIPDSDTPGGDLPVEVQQDLPQEFTTPPVRSNPYLETGHTTVPLKPRSAAPRVATLPQPGPKRDWNPIRQPD